MLLIYIFYMLQISYSAFTGNEADDESTVNTFNQFFLSSPKIGDIMVAKIKRSSEKVEPQAYIKGETSLDSNETYLLLTRTSDSTYNLHYWVGMNTTLDDKKNAAKFAVQLHASLEDFLKRYEKREHIYLAREKENMESTSFQVTIGHRENAICREIRKAAYIIYNHHINSEFPSHPPNLYIVRGERTTRIKKVIMDPKWLKTDTCLILESGYSVKELPPINIYCGPDASLKAQDRVRTIIRMFHRIYTTILEGCNHQIFKRADTGFKMFVQVLEDCQFTKPFEVENSDDHLKDAETFVQDRDQNVKYFKFSWEKSQVEAPVAFFNRNMVRQEVEERPMFLTYFSNLTNCYIVETASIVGIYVLFGKYTRVTERVRTIEHAEDYLDYIESNTFVPQCMRINIFPPPFISSSKMFDFKINMVDFPFYENMRIQEHW